MPVAVAVSSDQQPSYLWGGWDPSPFLCSPHCSLPVVKPTSLHFAASNLPWPEGSLAAQLISWLICVQPATGLEGAHGSPKCPPWQPSDMDQARIQMENNGLSSHNPGVAVVHYSEGSLVVREKSLSKQSSFLNCFQGSDFPWDSQEYLRWGGEWGWELQASWLPEWTSVRRDRRYHWLVRREGMCTMQSSTCTVVTHWVPEMGTLLLKVYCSTWLQTEKPPPANPQA